MKWEAHTRTAEKILADFDAYHFKKYEKDLVNGIIYPDSNDPKPHLGREVAIKAHIMKARERRLEYNANDSFFYLGMAFHYIQDSWVGLDPDHEDYPKYEKLIDKCQILDPDEDLFKYYPVKRQRVLSQFKQLEEVLKTPVKTPAELYQVALTQRPYESTAFLDLNISYRVCFRVAEMVLRPMLNVSLNERLEQVHIEYTEKLRKAEESESTRLHLMRESVNGIPREGMMNGFKLWRMKRALRSRRKAYEHGRHLKKIRSEYAGQTKKLSWPFVDWYNVEVPEILLEEASAPVDVLTPDLQTSSESDSQLEQTIS